MLSTNSRLFNSFLVVIINIMLFISSAYSMEQADSGDDLQLQVDLLKDKIDKTYAVVDKASRHMNEALHIAVVSAKEGDVALEKSKEALKQAENAFRLATEASESTETIRDFHDKVVQAARDIDLKLEEAYKKIQENFEDLQKKQHERKIEVKIVEIEEMEKRGVYRERAKLEAEAMAGARVEVESVRWDKIKKIITSPELVLTTSAIATFVYLAKHGIPYLINRLSQPSVVIETSNKNKPGMSITDLIFSPVLQKQLFDLALRIKSAKTYNENLPNMLFYGAPGTGKTAFVRALADESGLNCAFTSGTEFAKIKDLNLANNELRKLLNWANNDKKGLIIFIDEAESLFSNRKLPETSKTAQDFINTFLALVPEKSNKKLMFIFATNHPFKLDDAIIDRIGPKIEFVLPEARERIMILSFYLQRFADENKNAKVDIHSEVKEKLALYSESLAGFSPRAIKFVAEEMIINARRQECKLLTHEIAQSVLDEATKNLNQEDIWKSERDEWVAARRA